VEKLTQAPICQRQLLSISFEQPGMVVLLTFAITPQQSGPRVVEPVLELWGVEQPVASAWMLLCVYIFVDLFEWDL
jgi:hypothetical protein